MGARVWEWRVGMPFNFVVGTERREGGKRDLVFAARVFALRPGIGPCMGRTRATVVGLDFYTSISLPNRFLK